MGLRATVIKKYEVEYGNANGFNYNPDTLANIIMDFCKDAYTGDDGCGGNSTDAIWEIDKEQFRDMVDQLAEMPVKEFNERMKEDWFWGTFSDEKPYTKKYVLDVFKGWLAETPENSNYVRIGWL
jgi:hypothetical protein